MTKYITICAMLLIRPAGYCQSVDSIMGKRIFDEALSKGMSYQWLGFLSLRIGHRLSGSPQAEKAVEWSKKTFSEIPADTVYLQEIMVPKWERGTRESAAIFSGLVQGGKNLEEKMVQVAICALGGSIATPEQGITANVVEVKNFEELATLGKERIKDKIVFFNYPMNPTYISTGKAYGEAVEYRWRGASEAARYGAVASLIRSVTHSNDDYPHTGFMQYVDSLPKIPAAAVSTTGAAMLSNLLVRDTALKLFLKMDCKTSPDVKSHNVIAEIRGSEFPNEIVVVSGHLDSWDLGQGAHDDGAGCVQAMETLRLLHNLGVRPKRTIRAVLFMNEENGSRGAMKYAEEAKKSGEKHIAAIESDGGGFAPVGFGIKADNSIIEKISRWKDLFVPYGIHEVEQGWGGADINKLEGQCKAMIGLEVDGQRYFDYHHSAADTFDKVNKRELELGAAAMTWLAWLLSEYGL